MSQSYSFRFLSFVVLLGSLLSAPAAAWSSAKGAADAGSISDPESLWDPLNLSASQPDDVPLPASRSWVEIISWEPRAFIYHNFITPKEARHLVELAAPQMKRSTVVGPGGKSVEDGYRTSYGTFLKRYQDKVVQRVENRVAAWTHIPVTHQEDVQVLRYGIGQFYKVHADTLRDPEAGVRVATVLLYLNEPTEGGETAFPSSTWVNASLEQSMGKVSECAKGHVAFKPKRGDALLFWSINPDGDTEDFHASHTGCPVLSGVKWTATKWIHAKPFRPYEVANAIKHGVRQFDDDPRFCSDRTASCAALVQQGKCEEDKDNMIVSATGLGMCRKSCGACIECSEGDEACFSKNRENVGYLTYNPGELQAL